MKISKKSRTKSKKQENQEKIKKIMEKSKENQRSFDVCDHEVKNSRVRISRVIYPSQLKTSTYRDTVKYHVAYLISHMCHRLNINHFS